MQEIPEIPHDFVCPISLDLMTGPVICLQSGMVYDFSSMHVWLTNGAILPISITSK